MRLENRGEEGMEGRERAKEETEEEGGANHRHGGKLIFS